MLMNFLDRLNAAIRKNNSLLFVGLDPNPEWLPARYGQGSSIKPLRAWLRFLIDQTADLVCAYKPTLGFYQALGPEGLALLVELREWVGPDLPLILDAKHADLNTATLMARTVFEDWHFDGITLNPYAGQDVVAPFLLHPHRGVFVLCCTANPAAQALQTYPSEQTPLYLQVVREACAWGLPEQLGLEVGPVRAEVLARLRAAAPERVILLRSVWALSEGLDSILAAGLDTAGSGLLVPVPLEMLVAGDPATQVDALRRDIEKSRHESTRQDTSSSCSLWQPDVCLLVPQSDPHLELTLQLFDSGCVLFGEHVQASGAVFPYYIDLRRIISNPQLFHQVLLAYAQILQQLRFDRLAGIPYGSLPTASGLALHLNVPLIFPRKEVKAHGTRRAIKGSFEPGEVVVVVDDVLISGKSALEGAQKLESAGLVVNDIVVLIEHEPQVRERLREHGYTSHAVLPFARIARTLHAVGRITDEQYRLLQPEEAS